MRKKDKQIEFKVGDRVVTSDTNEKGTIARFCADKDIVYVRWDTSNQQEMVETKNLRKAND